MRSQDLKGHGTPIAFLTTAHKVHTYNQFNLHPCQVCQYPYPTDGAFAGQPELLGRTLAVIILVFVYIVVFTLACLVLTNSVLRLKVSGECGYLSTYRGGQRNHS